MTPAHPLTASPAGPALALPSPPAADSGDGGKGRRDKKLKSGMAVANISLNFAREMVDGASRRPRTPATSTSRWSARRTPTGRPRCSSSGHLIKTATGRRRPGEPRPADLHPPGGAGRRQGRPGHRAGHVADRRAARSRLYVGNDNYELGATLAKEALKRLGADPQGTIVVGVPEPRRPGARQPGQGHQRHVHEEGSRRQGAGPVPDLQRPGQNFSAWSSLVNANPGALAFLGVGDADSYDLAKIKKQSGGKYLVAGFDVDAKTLEASRTACYSARLDPEHFLKGYIAMQLLIDTVRAARTLPKGWFKTPGLVVD